VFAVDAGIRAGEDLVPRTTEERVAVGNLSVHLHRQRLHECNACRDISAVLQVRTSAIAHDVFAHSGGVEIDRTRREEILNRTERIDVDVNFDHRVIWSEGKQPNVRCGPNHIRVNILVGHVELREHLKTLLNHHLDHRAQDNVLVGNVRISEVEVTDVRTGARERYVEIRNGDEDIGREEGIRGRVVERQKNTIVLLDDGLLDGQTLSGDVITQILRTFGDVTQARGWLVDAFFPCGR